MPKGPLRDPSTPLLRGTTEGQTSVSTAPLSENQPLKAASGHQNRNCDEQLREQNYFRPRAFRVKEVRTNVKDR